MNVGFHFGGVVLHNVVIHPVGMESMYGDMSVVVYVILGIIVLCSIILFANLLTLYRRWCVSMVAVLRRYCTSIGARRLLTLACCVVWLGHGLVGVG